MFTVVLDVLTDAPVGGDLSVNCPVMTANEPRFLFGVFCKQK